MNLAEKKCVPCEGGIPPMSQKDVEPLMSNVPGWNLEGGHLIKVFKFKNFKHAMNFVNKVAEIAEQEQHHPDIKIQWNKVTLELWTHAIKGLSENDFIMAAKINNIKI